jgi:hypothetical protein
MFIVCLAVPVSTSLDFATISFYRPRLLALQPTPNLEGQVSVFIFPSDRVAQLYPQAPGSLSVAFYDSKSYGGDILTHLNMGLDDIYTTKNCSESITEDFDLGSTVFRHFIKNSYYCCIM